MELAPRLPAEEVAKAGELPPRPDGAIRSDFFGSWTTPVVVRASSRDEMVCNLARRVVAFDPKTGANALESARETLLSTLEGVTQGSLTDVEVERAKTALLKQRELLMNDSNRIGVVLSDWAADGDWRPRHARCPALGRRAGWGRGDRPG